MINITISNLYKLRIKLKKTERNKKNWYLIDI